MAHIAKRRVSYDHAQLCNREFIVDRYVIFVQDYFSVIYFINLDKAPDLNFLI